MDKNFLNENDINLLEGKKKLGYTANGKKISAAEAEIIAAENDNNELEKYLKQSKKNLKSAKYKHKVEEDTKKRLRKQKLLKESDLIELLESNGYEVSYTNLCLLKEGIENGTIEIEDDEQPQNENIETEEGQEAAAEEAQPQPSKSATITPDGTLQMAAGNAEVVASPDGTMTANLYESEYQKGSFFDSNVISKKMVEQKSIRELLEIVVKCLATEKGGNNFLAYFLGGIIGSAISANKTYKERHDDYLARLKELLEKSPVSKQYLALMNDNGSLSPEEKLDMKMDVANYLNRQFLSKINRKERREFLKEEDENVIETENEEVPVEAPEGEYPEEDAVENGAAPRVMISMPVDGSMTIDNQGKQITADAQGNVNVALAEAFRSKRNTERFLNSFLTEDCYMQLKEYQTLTEEVKAETVKDIATFLLQTIEEKIVSVDTTCADRSRGDVKQLKELQPIQDALTQLEALLERSEEAQPECKQAVSVIIKAILYLNQYSAVFKEAYRNKKTVMILKYQSVILSIISSISYILSVAVDYKGGNIKIKRDIPELKDFAPLKSLEEFVVSVDSGEFKTITKDVNFLREYYLEVSVEQMSSLLEATDYVDMIVGGVKNIYDQLTTGDLGAKISDILYKAIGVITLLLSLRSTLYTLFRMKTRVSDMIGGIQQFADANNGGGALNKLTQFANKFRVDAENGSEISQHEIETENKRVLNQVRTVQTNTMINRNNDDFKPEELVSNKTIDTNNDFGFDF